MENKIKAIGVILMGFLIILFFGFFQYNILVTHRDTGTILLSLIMFIAMIGLGIATFELSKSYWKLK